MEGIDEQAIGYISYEWDGAPKGVIDAHAGGTALIGIDEALRFFNRKQAKGFNTASYEIPVRTGEGSWIAIVLGLLAIPAVAFTTGYAKKAGEKMAERDFKELGFKDIARKSVDALERLIELIKHTRRSSDWKSDGLVWKENATIVGIKNDQGEILYLPTEYFKWYLDLPKGTLKKLVTPVTKGRHMIIGANDGDGQFRTVRVTSDELGPFLDDDNADDEEFLFPELIHGEDAVLEGLITRGNQETNSMGFQYHGHILNCVPDTGNIRRYKPAIFLHCKIEVTVNRHVGSPVQLDRRPTLIVRQVIAMEVDNQSALF